MRRVALAAAVLALALAATAPAATRRIAVGDYYFVRSGSSTPTVTVRRGTTVTWVWRGHVRHNVFVRSGPVRFRSRTVARGTFSRRMTKAGTYRIVCTIHPGMAMTLRVS
jgi:plastocyanin